MSSMITRTGHICHLKMTGDLLTFDNKCTLLKSSLVTFIGIIRFILSIFFYKTNGVVIKTLVYIPGFFFLSSLFIIIYAFYFMIVFKILRFSTTTKFNVAFSQLLYIKIVLFYQFLFKLYYFIIY